MASTTFAGYFPSYWIANSPTATSSVGTVYVAGQCSDSTGSNYLPPGVYYALSRNTTGTINQIGGTWFTVAGTGGVLPLTITAFNPMGLVNVSGTPVAGVGLKLYTASPPLTQVIVENGTGAAQTVFSVIYKYI